MSKTAMNSRKKIISKTIKKMRNKNKKKKTEYARSRSIRMADAEWRCLRKLAAEDKYASAGEAARAGIVYWLSAKYPRLTKKFGDTVEENNLFLAVE